MPIIPLKCPSCGAQLQADSDSAILTCKYCGTNSVMKDAIVQNYIQNTVNISGSLFAVTVPLAVWGSFAPLAAAAGYGAALWYACRQLGGMSGDVSGFALTLGELCGLAVLTLVR